MWQKLQGSGFNYRIKVLNVTMLCFAVTLAIAPSSPADVVGRYAFTTIDVSESISGIPAYNGTLENGAKISDGSVVLDGTNQYVDLSYGLSSFMSALSGSCSFEAWVNWSGTGSLNQQIFDFGNGVGTDSTGAPAINPHMYISANYGTTGSGNLRYALEPAGLAKNNGPLNASGPLGTTPTYIAVVYNATRTTMANKTLYVNGVAVASFVPTADGTPFPSSLTLANNYVGKSQADEVNFFSTYFKGSISDLRFWNNALSAADISAHYTAEANGLAVWTGSSGGNFNEAAKWDTGIMPGTNTTVVIVNGNSMDLHGYGANPDDKSVGGVSLYSGTIQDSLGTGKLTSATTINVEQGAISAKLDGMTGLTKSTVNVVTLSGANTFTGGVTVNGGTLQLGNAAALGSTSNIVTINNAGSILDIYGNSPTISGIVLTNGSLVDYNSTKGTIIGTGTFELQNGSVSAFLSGTAGLNKTTTASVQLSGNAGGANSYTGGTTVTAGTLSCTDAQVRLGSNVTGNDITVMSGARLEMANSANLGASQNLTIQTGAVATIDSIGQALINKLGVSGYGVLAMNMDNSTSLNFNNSLCLSPVSLGASGSTTLNYTGTITPYLNTFRLGGAGGTLNVTGPLQDAITPTPAIRSLIVNGGGTGGTVILSGVNTYSGGTTVVTGTLQVAAGFKLGSNVGGNTVTVQNGGTLNLAETANIGDAQPLTINSGGVVSIAFPITTAFLAKPTPDSTGTIAVSGDSADPLTFTSGVSIGASAASTLSGTITPYNDEVNPVVYRFGCGGAALTVTSALTDGSVRSVVISAGTGGNVTFTPDPNNFPNGNTYTGGTTVNGGTFVLGSAVALPTTGTLNLNGGTTNLGGNSVTIDALTLNGGTLSTGTLASRTTYELRSGTSTAVLTDYTDSNSVVTSIGVTKTGTGTATLQAANSYTGKIVVQEGTLRINGDGSLGAVPPGPDVVVKAITLNAGTSLRMWNSVTVSGYREIYLAGTANINEEAGYSITIINSPISGPGGLTINGDSNTRFGGNNTYDGDTHILTGRLSLTFRRDTTDPNNTIEQVSTSLPYGPGKGNVIIDAGAELNIQDAWTWINGLYGAGNILKTESSTKNLTIGNADRDGDYSGTIGPGLTQNLISITKVGAGTQYFRAVDSGYTAATTITAGTLAVAKMDNGGAVSSIGISSAASTGLTIGSDVDTATATLKYIGTGDTTDRRFSVGLSAAFDSSGAGPIQFLPATGSTMGNIGTGVHTVTLTGTNTGDNIMDVRLVDTDSPTNLVKSGTGKWVSTINHTYKGNTTVLNGILDLMAVNTPDATVSVAAGELDASSIVANTLTIGNGATVVIKAISGGPQAGMESLSPVPEPSTWALLILAALVFGIYRRRSR